VTPLRHFPDGTIGGSGPCMAGCGHMMEYGPLPHDTICDACLIESGEEVRNDGEAVEYEDDDGNP
jgi:hypothetical protein